MINSQTEISRASKAIKRFKILLKEEVCGIILNRLLSVIRRKTLKKFINSLFYLFPG